MADEVTLLSVWMSPFGLRVQIALAEKGVQYEKKEEDLRNKSPLLLKMNPVSKQIPVLVHNGRPICESMIIVEYIDEVWNHKSPLLPADPYKRANARFWVDYIGKSIYPNAFKLWSSHGDPHEEAKRELLGCFKVLEQELGSKDYFGDDSFGVTDVALIPFYTWFYTLEKLHGLKMSEECPKLVAWGKRCMERESVGKTLPDEHKVYEFIAERWKKQE